MTREKLFRILTSHIGRCGVHKALSKALHPFILINPKQKTEDIMDALEKEKEDIK